MKDVQTEYYELKSIFMSGYNNNGKNIEMAIYQTSQYTGKTKSEIIKEIVH